MIKEEEKCDFLGIYDHWQFWGMQLKNNNKKYEDQIWKINNQRRVKLKTNFNSLCYYNKKKV